ncbi:MAG: tetraacyldisaccharide 4'-kinase [Planctomycetota bacterium]|nr:tetraacyldisaccharide 4'-kinase [Planctomycetota bacterium]
MAKRSEDLLDRRGGAVELLRLPALAFGAVAELRRWLYDKRLLPSARLDVPIVCVGNLIAGGTGKTPMVVEVVGRLAQRGRRPGILSRGYGKAGAGGMLSDEARLFAELCGDLPRVAMPDRVDGARQLIEDGADVVVMDDGLQHRRLGRDLDLVLVDATRPWGLYRGPRAFLPRGLMRESPKALRRAGAIVLTRCDQVDADTLEELELELAAWAPGTPRLLTRHVPVGLRRLGAVGDLSAGVDGDGLELLAGRAVVAVSAIGNPGAFARSLTGLGARLVGERRFADHHEYTAADLGGLAQGGAPPLVVTTAKDAVKLAPLVAAGGPHADLAVHVLDIALEVTRGSDVLDALLDSLPRGAAVRERDALHSGMAC